MFGKAKCKLCNNNVRFALRHLKEKHPETLKDTDVIKLNMSRIMEKYFVWHYLWITGFDGIRYGSTSITNGILIESIQILSFIAIS